MMNLIVVSCPNCAQKYRVPPDRIGLKAKCRCGTRFTLSTDQPIDDETVFGWVMEEADPASGSVMGSTGIVESPVAPQPPRSSRPQQDHLSAPQVIDQTRLELRLERLDELGAHFEFPVSKLEEDTFRMSFPKQCVCCNGQRSLDAYLIVWVDRLRGDERQRLHDGHYREVGRLQEIVSYDKKNWYDDLPATSALPEPYSKPFPFYACSTCAVGDEVSTAVVNVGGQDICRLNIANLEVAAKFFRNNGGRKDPSFEKLVREYEKQKKDRWRSLPTAIRRHIQQWHEMNEGETFQAYFPDADFTPAEAGKAGLVLTDRRLTYHKYTSSREYDLAEAAKVFVQPDPETKLMNVRFVQKGKKDALAHLQPDLVAQLLEQIKTQGKHWKVNSSAR